MITDDYAYEDGPPELSWEDVAPRPYAAVIRLWKRLTRR
jgi:hypothetical protein